MNSDLREAYILRDGIMNLLSDEEVARVSTAETADHLSEGDEYIDLERLDQGVRLALGVPPPMGRVLPRSAVQVDTWSKILMHLTAPHIGHGDSDECLTTPRNT